MKTKIITCSTAVIALMMWSGCVADQDADTLMPVEQYQVTAEDYTFFSDPEKYQDTRARRLESAHCTYSWSIQNVSRNANVLTVDIARPQGCEVLYELIWDGAVMESYPMMANVFVHPRSAGCTDQAEEETDRLVIDLKEAFKNVSETTLRDINFNIREVCTIKDVKCMEDCDLSVSD